ncbi:MAG: hypothetical protein NTX65_08525 [Ignavibacteriales bacterium]|nr:hypothetical protein [Ignavibacteriales bacterium]
MEKPLIEKLSLFNNLNSDTKQLWGKMSAQHMVEHLILAVRTSNGKLNVGCFIPPEKWPVLKKILISSRPLPRDFINPIIGENLLPLEYETLAEAKNVLALETEAYYIYFENNQEATLLNPTFGELNKTEWDIFHRKHFTHHLAQFGIIF